MEPIKRAIPMRDGVKIYTEVVEHGAKYWLIASHGIGEHLGRHKYLQEVFGFDVNVFQYDLRGHGRSGGEKAYIDPFDQFMEDLKDIIQYLKTNYKMEGYILYGHSMGALITCGFVQNYLGDDIENLRAMIVNAPPVGVGGPLGKFVNKVKSGFFNKLANIKMSVPLGGLVDLNTLSHRNQVIEEFNNDPLNHKKLHTKLLLEMVASSKNVFSRRINDKVEKYISYGTGDTLISVPELEKYLKEVDPSFTVRTIEGARHEQYQEIEKYRVPYFNYLRDLVKSLIF
ncbi:alpha/beta fold hydrolase [Halobacteriovorax sp. YZS-1-1]|uniref:alpha/beta fold hydrolase n=1 Tax=unclassified Halobacteriovorax TaxID=2639665 RepID=UPI00399B7FE8